MVPVVEREVPRGKPWLPQHQDRLGTVLVLHVALQPPLLSRVGEEEIEEVRGVETLVCVSGGGASVVRVQVLKVPGVSEEQGFWVTCVGGVHGPPYHRSSSPVFFTGPGLRVVSSTPTSVGDS